MLKAIDNGKSEGGPVGRHWVLDPIDGTKGYDFFSLNKKPMGCEYCRLLV